MLEWLYSTSWQQTDNIKTTVNLWPSWFVPSTDFCSTPKDPVRMFKMLNSTLPEWERHSLCVQDWWSPAQMTTEECYNTMKPHRCPPISSLTCRTLGGASQRSAVAILRCGLIGGVVMVTASQGCLHTSLHSHTCLAHSLEESLAALGGERLLRLQQSGNWLLKSLEGSQLIPLSSILLSICLTSPAKVRCQVRCKQGRCQCRGRSSSCNQVRVRGKKIPRRGIVSVVSVGKGFLPQRIWNLICELILERSHMDVSSVVKNSPNCGTWRSTETSTQGRDPTSARCVPKGSPTPATWKNT